MNTYDAIVIGAGNGGLVAGLRLAKNQKKVLILESNAVAGGFATSFVRGRFEFEASLHSLCHYGKDGKLQELFQSLGIADKIDFVPVPNAYHVYSKNTKEDFVMPFGVDEYIEKMEEYVPGSQKSITAFFDLAKICVEALDKLKNHEDMEEIVSLYPDFMKVIDEPVSKVLQALQMPKKAQDILTTYWVYLGSPSSTLSFVHFASMVYAYISLGGVIPKKTSHKISLILAEEFTSLGGEIKYLSTVERMLVRDGKIVGVALDNGEEYYADVIISSVSPHLVYGKMLPQEVVPKNALKLTNSRVLGAKGFAVYLGLNQSAKELGLEDYSYFVCNQLDSNQEFKTMSKVLNGDIVATVINNVSSSASPKGTCMLNLVSLHFGDAFAKMATIENYFDLKNKIANYMIEEFEQTTGIYIGHSIEEIEIATPVTFARYGHHPEGVIYGYKATGMDNMIPRILNQEEERYFDNLVFCGGFSEYLLGYSATYFSGDAAAQKVLKGKKEGE